MMVLFSLLLFGVQKIAAQPVGSPVLSNAPKQVTFSVLGGYFRRDIGGVQNNSPRAWLKAGYGLAPGLDAFLLLGIAKVDLEFPGDLDNDLEDDFHPAYGGGVTFQVARAEKLDLSFFVTGHAFRFVSTPGRRRLTTVAGTDLVETLSFKYDWREINIGTGILKRMGAFSAYFGLSTKAISRRETQSVSLGLGQGSSPVSQLQGTYQSGLSVAPQAGAELLLPTGIRLSLEVTGRGRRDFAFFFGLSQSGIR